MRKLLIYCSFAVASLIVIAAFLTATTYVQLGVAIIIYPLLVYFAFKVFPNKTQVTVVPPPVKLTKAETAKGEDTAGIADTDKRLFLKLIGGAGLSLFLFSIFNKRAAASFFSRGFAATGSVSLTDAAGNKIDPAQSHPTDGYKISEIDDGVVTFYGFTNKDGAWYVMREDTDTGSFRYSRGDSSFSSNWARRENLRYDYYSNVF